MIHLQILPVAVENKPWVLLGCFVAIALLEMYSLFPLSQQKVNYFFVSEQKLTFQSWVDYASTRTSICVLLFLLRQNIPRFNDELNIFFWAAVGYLFDYFVMYNDPFAYIFPLGLKVPISYTLFMIILLGIVTVRSFIKWQR